MNLLSFKNFPSFDLSREGEYSRFYKNKKIRAYKKSSTSKRTLILVIIQVIIGCFFYSGLSLKTQINPLLFSSTNSPNVIQNLLPYNGIPGKVFVSSNLTFS